MHKQSDTYDTPYVEIQNTFKIIVIANISNLMCIFIIIYFYAFFNNGKFNNYNEYTHWK